MMSTAEGHLDSLIANNKDAQGTKMRKVLDEPAMGVQLTPVPFRKW